MFAVASVAFKDWDSFAMRRLRIPRKFAKTIGIAVDHRRRCRQRAVGTGSTSLHLDSPSTVFHKDSLVKCKESFGGVDRIYN